MVGRSLILLVCCLLLRAAAAEAVIVGGGGNPATDCLAVFDAPANSPATSPRNVVCADGDATCDADGTVNGRCEFDVAMCINSTADPRCTLAGVASVVVEHAEDNGEPRFDPDFQALQQRIDNAVDPLPNSDPDVCSSAATITVPVLGPYQGNVCRRNRKQLRVVTQSVSISGFIYRDSDRLRLTCEPAVDLQGEQICDAMVFFTDTFDRIQRQIFDQSCAKSACHDSQTHQANLILEAGASHTNLVNAFPYNLVARDDLGWKRVTVTAPDTGDPATSFLYHKVTGDLPPGTGNRMPLTGRKLDDYLTNIIRLWIEAGAPSSGWLPGTF